MPPSLYHFRVGSCLVLALLATGCVRSNFFPADARVGPGSETPLPAATNAVQAAAGRQYSRHSAIYHALLGRHYRHVWAAPVTAPVLHLATAAPGGLKPGKAGGGYQSISMTLTGVRGQEYALRALDKEPSKTLPKVLRHSFALNAVRDATSAAMPYGALTVPPLAQAAGVAHAHPRLVYIRPDEQGLGELSKRFQGKLALLEEKYSGSGSSAPALAGATDFVGSEAMLGAVYANAAHAIDQRAFLRARLLDVLLGDWDRHEGQWQWARFAAPGGRVRYQAIPKDRDQVYYRFDDGLVPWLISRPFAAPQFQTFKSGYGYLPGLVHQARFIDQRALSALTGADFRRMALDLQRRLPDTLITRAMRQLPPAVFALEGARLAAALRQRRDDLPEAAEAFYRTLARAPTVAGSAQAERFVVRRQGDSTTVRVYSRGLRRPFSNDSLRFERTFFSTETRALILEGLGGNDVFDIGTADFGKPMRLTVYGGAGADQVQAAGSVRRLKVFDTAADTATPSVRSHAPQKKLPAYDRLADN